MSCKAFSGAVVPGFKEQQMSSSVSATDKVRAQQSSLAKRDEAGREPDRAAASEALQTPRQIASSFSVALSEDALERMLAAREALSRFAIESAQSRKDYARSQVERIKERIETLKKLLMMLGDSAARAILREIKQLSGELGAAASVLREGDGGGGSGLTLPPVQAPGGTATAGAPDTATGDAGADAAAQTGTPRDASAVHDGDADGQPNTAAPTPAASAAAAMYAAVASTPVESGAVASGAVASGAATPTATPTAVADDAAGDADSADSATGASVQVSAQAQSAQARQAEAAQRREDAKSLEEALRALKALLAMAQAKIREGDEAARRDAEAAAREIGEIAQDVTALGLSSVPGGAGVEIPAAPGAGL